MFSLSTKLHLALAGFAGACALGYLAVVGERSGWVLLVFVAAGALIAAFAGLAGDVDERPVAESEGDANAIEMSSDLAARPSAGPLAVALAATALAVGLATGTVMVVAGILLSLLALAGWFAQVWREHPTFTRKLAHRLDDRLVAPVLLPVGAFLMVLLIAAGISRVLLAVNKDASALIAIVVAVAIIAALFLISARPRLSSSALVTLGVMGLAVVLIGGFAGAAKGERTFHPEGEAEPVLEFEARNVNFVLPDGGKVETESGSEVHISFENYDTGTYHNVAVYEQEQGGEGPTQGAPVFNGKPIPSGHIDYQFEAPSKVGSYLYVCDFHPNMKGELVVR